NGRKSEVVNGYTKKALINHIVTHPNWKMVKNKVWQIDHIFPISAFLEYGIEDVKVINALENLQPLTKWENGSKCNKYSKADFEEWLRVKGVKFESKQEE
ncbi:MAG TPA: hypothetical protein DHN29_08205, partial [Cytophagales bacterium]|nr:hypothetical protein [Cytophagales bacterium]